MSIEFNRMNMRFASPNKDWLSSYKPAPLEMTFGYTSLEDCFGIYEFLHARESNCYNRMGSIPLIGSIMGIARIRFGVEQIELGHTRKVAQLKEYGKYQIMRGVVETLSLGFLFIVPDLLVTLNRSLQCSKATLTHYTCRKDPEIFG